MYVMLLLFVFLSFAKAHDPLLSTYHSWKYMRFIYGTAGEQEDYWSEGMVQPEKLIPMDIDYAQDGRIFLVTPHIKGKVPATLNYLERKGKYLKLKPYPKWSWHQRNETLFESDEKKCHKSIIEARAIVVDNCQRLWVLDTGKVTNKALCEPHIKVFDLTTNKLISDLTFFLYYHDSTMRKLGVFTNFVVQSEDSSCQKFSIYVSDSGNDHIIAISSDRIANIFSTKYVEMDEEFSSFDTANETSNVVYPYTAMALEPPTDGTAKRLFFRPYSALYFVAEKISNLKTKHQEYSEIFYLLTSQATEHAFSSDGTLFFGYNAETAIGCWNTTEGTELKNIKIAAYDPYRLQFVAGIRVVYMSGVETLLVLTNNLPKFLTNSQNLTNWNFHILTAPVSKLKNRC